MMTQKKRRLLTGVSCTVLLLGSGAATAQTESEDGYRTSRSSGLHVRGTKDEKSSLAAAARLGGSVRISSGEEYDFQREGVEQAQEPTRYYTVQPGDTLWDICQRFFSDPYTWPMLWSYNPTITNPNWIYPGDVLALSPQGEESSGQKMQIVETGSGERKALVANVSDADLLLVRNRGFVDDELIEQAGQIVGARKEARLLSQLDEVYAEFEEGDNIRSGDEFAVYRVLDSVDAIDSGEEIGKMVEIMGTARVTSFDRDKGIARVVLDEALVPIERGAMIGPVHRKFDLVPSVTNTNEIQGHLLAFLSQGTMVASFQIVFIDRGAEDGVREGNRFFAVEQIDPYIHLIGEEDEDTFERFPKEVVAELRVVEARANTSTCIVTSSIRELQVGMAVEMRKGY
jgi:hypothetical protein